MIRCLKNVRVYTIDSKMIDLLYDIENWASNTGQTVVITGWQEPTYTGKAHLEGRALDIRINNLKHPEELAYKLQEMKWPLLYGPPDHKNHIHVQTDGICISSVDYSEEHYKPA